MSDFASGFDTDDGAETSGDGEATAEEPEPGLLGDVVLCPQVVGAEWQRPLVHGLLHLLGYEHGDGMEEREEVHASR